ncbi:MAG: ABC transporter permease [Chloroflexi bacterium]|nr:ABC transporter permease [Chloroflexota bacterium]
MVSRNAVGVSATKPTDSVSRQWRDGFLRAYPTLSAGIVIIALIAVFSVFGPLLVDQRLARVGALRPSMPPTSERILGTDAQGRDVFVTLVLATPETLKIALIAGIIGLSVGTLLGLCAGYFGGVVDAVVRIATDTLITIPGVLVLVLIAANLRTISVALMGLIVASLAWMYPARAIRSQTLSLRERAYIQVARLSGASGIEVVIKEIMPNLLPYILASFVGAVSGAALATVGLEVLGLGPQNAITLGLMIYWAQFYGAVLRGMWWWWGPPLVMIVLLFVGLLLISVGLDALIDRRLRSRV